MAPLNILSTFLFVIMLVNRQVLGICTLSSLATGISTTGEKWQGEDVFEFGLVNNCECDQSNVIVNCDGFHSDSPIDPKIFRKVEGGGCLINDGKPVHQGVEIKFDFTGGTPGSSMPPIKSTITC